MPRQTGPLTIIGTLHGITYFKMHGRYWKKKKTSLNRHMIYNLPSYKKIRAGKSMLTASAKLASRIYKLLPQTQKKGLKTWRRTQKLTRRYMALHLKKEVVVFKVLREMDFFPMTIGLHPEYRGMQHSVKLRKTPAGIITYTLIIRKLPKTAKPLNPKTFTISYLRPIFKTQPKRVQTNQVQQTQKPSPKAIANTKPTIKNHRHPAGLVSTVPFKPKTRQTKHSRCQQPFMQNRPFYNESSSSYNGRLTTANRQPSLAPPDG
jgi:hypothetical protein